MEFFLVGSNDGTAELFSTTTGDRIARFDVGPWVNAAEFAPGGQTIITGDGDGYLKAWDIPSGKQTHSILAHPGGCNCIDFSPNGDQVLTGGSDHVAKIWTPATWTLRQTLEGHHDLVACVKYNSDGTKCLTGSWDKTLIMWESQSGNKLSTVPADWRVQCAAWSHDNERIVFGGQSNDLHIFDLTTDNRDRLRGHDGFVFDIDVSDDGTIFTASQDHTVCAWPQPKTQGIYSHEKTDMPVRSFVANPSADLAVVHCGDFKSTSDGEFKTFARTEVRELSDLRSVTSTVDGSAAVKSLAISPNGKVLLAGLAGGATNHRSTSVFDLTNGKKMAELGAYAADWIAIDPRGELVALCHRNDVSIVQMSTRESVYQLAFDDIASCGAFIDQGKRLVVCQFTRNSLFDNGTTRITVSDMRTGHVIRSIDCPQRAHCLTVTRDGRLVACGMGLEGGENRIDPSSINIYNLENGNQVAVLQGHTRLVTQLAFTDDGTRLFSSSLDGSVRVWDVKRGQQVLMLREHAGPVIGFGLSPERLLAAGETG